MANSLADRPRCQPFHIQTQLGCGHCGCQRHINQSSIEAYIHYEQHRPGKGVHAGPEASWRQGYHRQQQIALFDVFLGSTGPCWRWCCASCGKSDFASTTEIVPGPHRPLLKCKSHLINHGGQAWDDPRIVNIHAEQETNGGAIDTFRGHVELNWCTFSGNTANKVCARM